MASEKEMLKSVKSVCNKHIYVFISGIVEMTSRWCHCVTTASYSVILPLSSFTTPQTKLTAPNLSFVFWQMLMLP